MGGFLPRQKLEAMDQIGNEERASVHKVALFPSGRQSSRAVAKFVAKTLSLLVCQAGCDQENAQLVILRTKSSIFEPFDPPQRLALVGPEILLRRH